MKTIRLIDDRKIKMVALDNFIFKIKFSCLYLCFVNICILVL